MITGILKPSSGNATIYGADLVDDIETVRQSLGLCQQFDVLFDVLTVREHLQLACDLKNVPHHEVEREIFKTLSTLSC
jgi:ABC-type multidrug transport system ATPase subunit